jgi:hypothetical protein
VAETEAHVRAKDLLEIERRLAEDLEGRAA